MHTLGRTKRAKRIQELEAIIEAEKTSIFDQATPQLDDDGKVIEEICTCGNCGLSWNDALITSWTPTPSGRCPFEYIHQEVEELKKLKRA